MEKTYHTPVLMQIWSITWYNRKDTAYHSNLNIFKADLVSIGLSKWWQFSMGLDMNSKANFSARNVYGILNSDWLFTIVHIWPQKILLSFWLCSHHTAALFGHWWYKNREYFWDWMTTYLAQSCTFTSDYTGDSIAKNLHKPSKTQRAK